MNILEELWWGNIAPCEQFVQGEQAYFAALRKVDRQREQLQRQLPADLQEMLEQLMQCQTDINALSEQLAFQNGFRLGAQIIAAALKDG